MASHFVILLLTLSILSVSSANGKNFPSLFNAKEVSYVSHAVVDGTNSKDVEGLTALLNKFSILQALSVNDDPCLGALPWFWIKCNTDPTPRVTELTLAGLQLVGSLPDFSSMDALEIIDLSNNQLNGPIPDFLGNLPKLQELNLARNNFRGTIPASLFNNPRISLKTAGNPDLCQSDKPCKETTSTNDPSDTTTSQIPVINYPPSNTTTSQIPVINYPPYSTTSETPYVYYPSTSKKKKNKLPAILGAAFSTRFLLWAIVGVFAIFRHKRKSVAAAVVNAGQKVDQGVASEQVPVDLEMDHQIQGNENQNGHAWDI